MSFPRLILILVLAGVGIGLLVLGIQAFGHPDVGAGGCDNMAGECLRMRQQAAIALVGLSCFLVAVICGLAGFATFRGIPGRFSLVALLLGAAVLVAVALVDPASHLDNRFTGWLS